MVSDCVGIGSVFVSKFKEIFRKESLSVPAGLQNLFSKEVSEEESKELISVPGAQEIKEVVFAINPWKAPGPDRFSGIFFHHYWEIVQKDVVSMVQDFFSSGKLVGALNCYEFGSHSEKGSPFDGW